MEQTYYFIVNSKARTGKGIEIWNSLEAVLKDKDISYKVYRTKHAGHAKQIANQLTSTDELRKVIIVGGDGTVNEVINGVHDFSKVSFGYVPIGSANDLAKGLGIDKEAPEIILKRILSNENPFAMDLGRTTDSEGKQTYFAISSGIGIDAEVSKAALDSKLKKVLNVFGLGAFTYKLLTIHKLFTMPHVYSEVALDDKEPVEIKKGIFVAGMNHPWEGGGVPMAPHANAFDGNISMCCVSGFSRFQAFFVLPTLLRAKHEGKKGFWHENYRKAVITMQKPMVVHADGEYLGMHNKITIECMPELMKFMY